MIGSSFKRYQSSHLSQKSLRPKLFSRKDADDDRGENLYEEGVEEIIKLRKFLDLDEETILIAVDIYKNFIKLLGWRLKSDRAAAYMASIVIAAKINEIYPPKMEDIVEACENLISSKKILAMERIICNISHFSIPLTQNLSLHLGELLGDQQHKKIEKCIKQAMKCLSDPILMEVDNKTLAKALIQILYPQINSQDKKIDSNLIRIIFKLKRKLNLGLVPLT